jgi:O-antigen/teichoic acid export membrane protein
VLFDVALARADLVLLGLLSTNAATADYSFAYRAYELARIPISVLGSVLMPRAARALDRRGLLQEENKASLKDLFTVTLAAAILGAALLNTVWAPAIDFITDGAYGTPTKSIVAYLSGCIPLSYAVTMLWTISFAARHYKATARITAIVAVVNLTANFLLIPVLGGEGAAAAFLGTTALQAGLYWRLASKTGFRPAIVPVIGMVVVAVGLLILSRVLQLSPVLEACLLLIGYPALAIASGLLRLSALKGLLLSLRR